MSGAQRLEPIRSCVGCRRRRPQRELVRVTNSERGVVVDGASDGRGAWLCRGTGGAVVEASCLDVALSRRAFARAWRHDLDPGDDDTIRELVGRRIDVDDRPSAH